VRHYYYTSAWQVLEERLDAATTAERQFVWGLRYIDDQVLRDRAPSGSGPLSERLYALQDANWNMDAIVNASGSVQERYSYTAYGVPTVLTPAFAPRTSSIFDWLYLYQGGRLDLTSALYHFRYRDLSPTLGRWLQQDPWGYVDGLSLCQYVQSNPTNRTDAFGLQGDVTGNCNISIFAGHIGPDATDFIRDNSGWNDSIVTGCGNYVGLVSCFTGMVQDLIPADNKIPDFPDWGMAPLKAENVIRSMRIVFEKARAFAATLCKNREQFCDDGTRDRYECGDKNQRCDAVTITITCDADMRRLMEAGIGPNGNPVRGLPTAESKRICGSFEVRGCKKP
ncbi:MAG: RHS repeat-associated core domain-containing protein, partial [Pirellulaceae bacterium]|nr:RHS repeat-associated core domain-containing protein [Pirellulaceae bacterium]